VDGSWMHSRISFAVPREVVHKSMSDGLRGLRMIIVQDISAMWQPLYVNRACGSSSSRQFHAHIRLQPLIICNAKYATYIKHDLHSSYVDQSKVSKLLGLLLPWSSSCRTRMARRPT
jgi:hypothetical protein